MLNLENNNKICYNLYVNNLRRFNVMKRLFKKLIGGGANAA